MRIILLHPQEIIFYKFNVSYENKDILGMLFILIFFFKEINEHLQH